MTAVDALGRAFGLYRRTAMSRSAIVLVLANVIPLVGVVFFGWSLLTILVLYWVENGIVGLWNIPKILLSQGSVMPGIPDMPDAAERAATASPEQAASLQAAWRQMRDGRAQLVAGAGGPAAGAPMPRSMPGSGTPDPLSSRVSGPLAAAGRFGLALFFAVHYGIFWLGHGFFVLFALPQFGLMGSPGSAPCFDQLPGGFSPPAGPGFPPFPGSGVECAASPFGEVLWGSVALAALALFVSHGASFLFNFVGRGEYRTASPPRQMGAVYGRVVVLHLTIIFGAMVVAFLGSPLGALLVLIVLKTAFDLTLHLREHRNAGARAKAPLPAPV